MKSSKIVDQEIAFSENLTNTSRVKYTEIDTQDLGSSMIRSIRPNFDSYYYKKETKKDMIVLHSTVGTIRADMASLTKKDNHVSVSYVIDRTGEIYELFDPVYWSYHLGKGSVGGNKVNSSRSIGIELSNYGPLVKKGENLETIYSQREYTDDEGNVKTSRKDVYCATADVDEYTIVEGGFRGYEYFASYTDEQYSALNELIDYLCCEFDIPKTLIDYDDRFKPFSSAGAKVYKGICSHVNYRKSGKWDLGPDFDWDKLMGTYIELDEVEIKLDDIRTKPEDVAPIKIKKTPTKKVKVKKRLNILSFIFKLFRK